MKAAAHTSCDSGPPRASAPSGIWVAARPSSCMFALASRFIGKTVQVVRVAAWHVLY
jgi:hypothetical protein